MNDTHLPPPPADPLVGKTLGGRYLVKRLLDRGGMGKVYEAEQQPLGRMVALKTLDLTDPHGEFQQRFFNEAATASRLRHPNTVRIFDYGRSDEGVYFITMELLEGQSLKHLIKTEAPLDPLRVATIGRQVCASLHEAHESGIVHRDLKPGNIFLTDHHDDEFAKVLDFGLVKNLDSDLSLSHTGQALGSPLYMSPEQVEGEAIDRRADIYALGLVMYVALCGKVPFKKGSVATVMMQHLTKAIPPFAEITPDVSVPPSLEWIVRRCIEKGRDDRFATMAEVSRALKLAMRELRGECGPIPWELKDGRLALPDGLFDRDDMATSGLRSGPTEPMAEALLPPLPDLFDDPDESIAAVPQPSSERQPQSRAAVDPIQNSLPSSPTLSQSRAGVAAGAALAGTGMVAAGIGVAALIVFLLIGAVVVASWQDGTPDEPPVTDVTPPPPVQPEPIAPPPEPEPAEPEVVTVTLSSEPVGAEVLRDGLYVGTTPHPVRIGDDPVRLTLQKDGYQPREVLVDGTVPELSVPLRKVQRATPRPDPAPQPEPDRGSTSDVRDPWEE
jgi:serine/threonine-protein kinase